LPQPVVAGPLPRRWSFRLGRIAGIDLYIHATFALLLAWVALGGLAAGALASLLRVFFVVAIFATIVLHELAHALVARRFGARTRNITLYPIGGIAHLERMPAQPRHEALVAMAGPLVNLAIGGALLGLLYAAQRPVGWPGDDGASLLASFAWTNLAIGLFNLLPAFPMDGGRALRAVLSMRLGPLAATRIATSIGKGMALLFAFAGLATNPMLLLIAVFVWLAASEEMVRSDLGARLAGLSVAQAMSASVPVMRPDDALGLAPAIAAGSRGLDVAVMEGDRLVGWLRFERMMEALSRGNAEAPVKTVMVTAFPSVDPAEALSEVVGRFDGFRAMPVVATGRLVGVLSLEDVARLAGALNR
jgi:Zn-dependent protease